jgi:hypothetical protein
MIELLIVVVIVLWLLGYFGPARIPAIPRDGKPRSTSSASSS